MLARRPELERTLYVEPEIVGAVRQATTIAVGGGIRELDRLVRTFGPGRWRKRKGIATVRMPDGEPVEAEVHWYEAHGVGRFEFKVKHMLPGRR